MAQQLEQHCDMHPDPFDCPDAVLIYDPVYRSYGLPVRDGGSSKIVIKHCPWCGVRLPRSLDEEWEAEVRGRGFDPDDDDEELPAELEWEIWMESRRSAG